MNPLIFKWNRELFGVCRTSLWYWDMASWNIPYQRSFTLWLCQHSYWKWPIEIVDFPIQHGGSFHSFLMFFVCLPEGKWDHRPKWCFFSAMVDPICLGSDGLETARLGVMVLPLRIPLKWSVSSKCKTRCSRVAVIEVKCCFLCFQYIYCIYIYIIINYNYIYNNHLYNYIVIYIL